MMMIYNLIVYIPSLLVESFDSAMDFHYQVWYGLASSGVKYLHIYHSVVYKAHLKCIDAQSN